jgi:ribose transport system ATP-binding protein
LNTLSDDFVIEMEAISKNFISTKALDNVNFYLRRGEVNCLLGENGAGKSTLIKVLSGAYGQDSGVIKMDGKPVMFSNPNEARKRGIIPIYQELDLVDCMSVAENIFMNNTPMKNNIVIDHHSMNKRAKELLLELGIDIDVEAKVQDFSVAYRQMIAIAKALSNEIKVLILDEPSAVLTGKELATLFEIIKKIKHKNVGIIYISHRLEEIFEIGDVVTILRDGQLIIRRLIEGLTRNDLIKYMVGHEINEDRVIKYEDKNKKVALEISKFTNSMIKDVSFALREGEILGVFGLVGAGRTELARAIIGIDKISAGEIEINGKMAIINSPIDAVNNGIGYVPEDRKNEGLIQAHSVKSNIILPIIDKLCRFCFLMAKKITETVQTYVEKMDIKIVDQNQLVKNLSGGNQQKVVMAKVLSTGSKILILDEPTRGIDVGAKSEIYKIIEDFVKDNHAIMLISSEMTEILNLSNRIMVMSEGQVTRLFSNNQASQEELLEYAMPKSLSVEKGGLYSGKTT